METFLSPFFCFVHCLDLCYSTVSHETFLLGTAAVANITFMDSQACEILQLLEAPKILIHAAGTKKAQSLFVKDQVVCSIDFTIFNDT